MDTKTDSENFRFIKKEYCGKRIKVKIIEKRGDIYFTVPVIATSGIHEKWLEDEPGKVR